VPTKGYKMNDCGFIDTCKSDKFKIDVKVNKGKSDDVSHIPQ